MASSGSLNTTGYEGRYLTFEWSIQSQSIENNTTTISWTLKGAGGGTSYYYTRNVKLVVDGETKYTFVGNSSSYITLKNGTVVASGTHTFTHNNDGTRTFTASAEAGIYSWPVNCTGSKTFTIDTIARATSPSILGDYSLGGSITIDTSSRASSGFTHNLYYSWGTQVIDELIGSGVTTSKVWTIPKKLAEYIQAGTSGTMYLKCVTYNGSTIIGNNVKTLTIVVPDTEEFKPKIYSVSISEANSVPIQRYVVGKTKLSASINADGAYVSGSANRNSYLAKAVLTVDNVDYPLILNQSSPKTFSIKTNTLISSGNKSGTVTITDSRGRTAKTTFTYTAYEYSPPVLSKFTANRCLEDGTLDDSGTYVIFGLNTTISDIDNQNAKTYKITYESGGKEVDLVSGTLSAYKNNVLTYNSYSDGVTFSVDSSWVVRAYVYDSLNAETPAVAKIIVPTESTFMDWRENGKGFAFGKVSTRDAFECAWPMYDRFDTLVTNGMAWYTGSGDSAVDPDVTKEHLVLTDKNTPGDWFWYIETFFYSTKSDTSSRMQIAYPYNHNSSVYMRHYYNGEWSWWREFQMVVESGTSGIWTYKKYTSGEAECWGRVSVTTGVTSAWGSLYSSGALSGSNVAFPFTFAEIPIVNVTLSGSSVGAFLMVTGTQTGGTTTTQTGYYEICRGSSLTSGNFVLNYHVKGRWK